MGNGYWSLGAPGSLPRFHFGVLLTFTGKLGLGFFRFLGLYASNY